MTCPACSSGDTFLLFNMGYQPLSLVSMQSDPDQSQCMERAPIQIVICERCQHCFNMTFDPGINQYSGEGCRMWNNGALWQEHVTNVARNIEDMCYSSEDCVLEIGAGDGEFLFSLNTPALKYAVDPCVAVERCDALGIQYVREYFDANKHLPETGDLLIVMRHLLEHIYNPRAFIENIARNRRGDCSTRIVVEVPCIENALADTRLADWTYEHPQHFTKKSLVTLMKQSGFRCLNCEYSYGDEVLVFYGFLDYTHSENETDAYIDNFAKMSLLTTKVGAELKAMGDDVAYWGGAGKSAMFINYLGLPKDTVVVDSDENKVGMYVPGTSIPILHPDKLLIDHVSTIVVTTAWRARDIALEIKRRKIPCERVWSFERGQLVEVYLG